MSKFDKKETMTIKVSSDLDHYHHGIYVDKTSKVKIATSYDLSVLPDSCEEQKDTEVQVLKHVWVDVWDCGEVQSCYVESFQDIPVLMDLLLQNNHDSNVSLRASKEFIQAAIDKV